MNRWRSGGTARTKGVVLSKKPTVLSKVVRCRTYNNPLVSYITNFCLKRMQAMLEEADSIKSCY